MKPQYITAGFLALILAFTISVAQTDESCTGNEVYCFGEDLYRCENGVPQIEDICQYACENGACVQKVLEPATGNELAIEEPEAASNYIIWIVLAIVLFAILYFYLRVKIHNKKKE